MVDATVRHLLAGWTTSRELANELGVSAAAVRKWRARNRIPARYWPRLAQVAQRHGVDGVSIEALLHLAVTPQPQQKPSPSNVRSGKLRPTKRSTKVAA